MSKSKKTLFCTLQLILHMPKQGLTFNEMINMLEECTNETILSGTLLRYLRDIEEVLPEIGGQLVRPGPGRRKEEQKYQIRLPMFSGTSDKRVFLLQEMLRISKQKPWLTAEQMEEEVDDKLFEQLIEQAGLTQYIRKMRERVVFMQPQIRQDTEMAKNFGICFDALAGERILTVSYGGKMRKVHPYGLIYREDRWYLFVYCETAEDVRMFRLDRMNLVEKTQETFSYPEEFSLAKEMENAFSTYLQRQNRESLVTIRLRARGLPAEDLRSMLFHSSQMIQELGGGEVEAVFRLETWDGMLSWLLRWGDLVEVLAPDDLRARLAEIAGNMLRMYQRET